MKCTNRVFKTLFLTIAVLSVSACSHGIAVQEFADTASPREEVTKLDTDMNTALHDQVNVLSPNNFEQAQDSLKEAKTSLDKQGSAQDTLHCVAQGRAYLNRANEFAQLSHANIEGVINAREQAIVAGAPKAFASDFKEADDSLRDVTSDIEKNELKSAIQNRSVLQVRYLDLELQSIKQARLGQARDTIDQSLKEGAKAFAPRSLALAEKSVQDTDAFITANRHETDQIKTRSDQTLQSADHLLKITRDSKSGKKTSSEDLALKIESEQNKVTDKQGQLNAKENQLENVQNANVGLMSEQAFNQRFEQARSEFTKSEAEVYKQGNILTIRLRGLDFPVNQAVLKAPDFALLAKVQKVIRDFGKSSIVVEGHTDSNGGMALNQRLSSARAEAVREYLVSNVGDEPMNIKAIGYGYQKPLATNKTADGRAQNRRVDVLIRADNSKAISTN